MTTETKTALRTTENEGSPDRIDRIIRIFNDRYRKKKLTNLGISAVIAILGITSFIYGLHLEPSVTIFRFMTVDGTIFTTIGALLYIIVNLVEIVKLTELTNIFVYYLRLSSAVAETVILIVVLFSQLPVFSQHLPVFDRYDSFIMHAVIPVSAVASFLLNDSPIGRLSARRRWHGTWFITFYAIIIFRLIGTGKLARELIPYFFLDIKNNPWYITVIAFVFIYGAAYLMSWCLSEGNRILSWVWFHNLTRGKNHT